MTNDNTSNDQDEVQALLQLFEMLGEHANNMDESDKIHARLDAVNGIPVGMPFMSLEEAKGSIHRFFLSSGATVVGTVGANGREWIGVDHHDEVTYAPTGEHSVVFKDHITHLTTLVKGEAQ